MNSTNGAKNRLAELGIEFDLLEHEHVFTMDDVARVLSIPAECQVKTLVLECKFAGSSELILCGISARGQLDLKKVAKVLSVSRSSLRLLDADHIESALGVPRGAIGLAHYPGPRGPLLSVKLCDSPFLYFGAGSNALTLKVSTQSCIVRLPLSCADIEK